ncbi:MAG TPA: hypothetical protein VL651_01740 [Bacteroidia bacterium]|jgi:hypothetical protein|nr:hypothetical protein [Bacteroidia bacterium]
MTERYPDKIIFGNYERADVLKWINDFRYFTFARGGLNEFVTDGDEFVVSFSFDGKEDLLEKMKALGIELKAIVPGEKTFDRKVNVSKENAVTLPDPIVSFPELAQPKFQNILGVNVYVFIGEGYFWIAVSNTIKSGEWWKVTPADVECCMKMEKLFDQLGWRSSRVYHTENYGRFVNRNNYPQYFQSPVESEIPERRADNAN